MTDKEALLLRIAVLEKANAQLRKEIARGVAATDPRTRASYVTAWFFGIAFIVVAVVFGYGHGSNMFWG